MTTPRVAKNVEELKLIHYCWEYKMTKSLCRTFYQVFIILNILIIRPRKSIPRYLPKRKENICQYKDLYTNIHSSFIHSSHKLEQPKCPLTDEWLNKLWCIHSMENYIILKSSELLIQATAWTNIKNMLNKSSQLKEHIPYDSIYTKSSTGKSTVKDQWFCAPGVGLRWEEWKGYILGWRKHSIYWL